MNKMDEMYIITILNLHDEIENYMNEILGATRKEGFEVIDHHRHSISGKLQLAAYLEIIEEDFAEELDEAILNLWWQGRFGEELN